MQIQELSSEYMSGTQETQLQSKRDVSKVRYNKNLTRKQSKGKKKKRSTFSLQDNQKILQMVLKIGPKFKKIARAVGGKPMGLVKNHFYKNLRYRWEEILGDRAYRVYNTPRVPHIDYKEIDDIYEDLGINNQLRQTFEPVMGLLKFLDAALGKVLLEFLIYINQTYIKLIDYQSIHISVQLGQKTYKEKKYLIYHKILKLNILYYIYSLILYFNYCLWYLAIQMNQKFDNFTQQPLKKFYSLIILMFLYEKHQL
ncbi:hypothetical protein pb186bvf_005777 [Paramecium bursaria]